APRPPPAGHTILPLGRHATERQGLRSAQFLPLTRSGPSLLLRWPSTTCTGGSRAPMTQRRSTRPEPAWPSSATPPGRRRGGRLGASCRRLGNSCATVPIWRVLLAQGDRAGQLKQTPAFVSKHARR